MTRLRLECGYCNYRFDFTPHPSLGRKPDLILMFQQAMATSTKCPDCGILLSGHESTEAVVKLAPASSPTQPDRHHEWMRHTAPDEVGNVTELNVFKNRRPE